MELHSMKPQLARMLVILGLLLFSLTAKAQPALSLQEAEQLALRADPGVKSLVSRQQSLQALSLAAAEWPDPVIRMGMMSLPTDSFNTGQEAMTQLLAGVVQKFPRGDTLALQQRQYSEQSVAMDYAARDAQLQVLQTVRQIWVDILLRQGQRQVSEQARAVFSSLVDSTRDYYASGQAQQQDVLQATVELGRVEDRTARFGQEERQLYAQLSAFIDLSAGQALAPQWPEWPALDGVETTLAKLKRHPRLMALQQQFAAAETSVDLARQQYKPEFSLDASYGVRSGYDPTGQSRPDLFSLMLVMDVPLFHRQRQDNITAARLASSSAFALERDDAHRRMAAQAREQHARLQELQSRLELYTTVLLPQAEFSADSAYSSYQSTTSDLSGLLRARIAEYELALEYQKLRAETLQAKIQVLYLRGEAS